MKHIKTNPQKEYPHAKIQYLHLYGQNSNKLEGKRNCIEIYIYTCVSMTVQLTLDYKAGEIENRRRSFHFSEFHNFDQS
jgi:hypothetical protein